MNSDPNHNVLAIILLNYNGQDLLREFLPTLINSIDTKEAKLYIVDNASTDGSVEFINNKFSEIELIRFERNYGYTQGFNKAIELISAEFYLTLSTDVEVTKGWYIPLLNALRNNHQIGACQPKILSFKDKESFEYAGAAGGFMDRYGYLFCRGRIFNSIEKDQGQYEVPTEVFWAGGCSLMVRGDLFKECGGFDDDFFAHMEEVDLCWRIHGLGYHVVSCPKSIVYHVGGSTLDYSNPFKLFLNSRNNLIMLVKNWPLRQLFFRLPVRLMMDWIGAIYFLFTRGFGAFGAVMKAHWKFLIGMPKWMRKRRLVTRQSLSLQHGMFDRSVVWEYFIQGRKSFKELGMVKSAAKAHDDL